MGIFPNAHTQWHRRAAQQQGEGDQLQGIRIPHREKLYPESVPLHGAATLAENRAHIRVTNQKFYRCELEQCS